MVHLSGSSGSQVGVTSTGTAFSSGPTDIAITATANGQASAYFYVTTRRPASLNSQSVFTQCDSQWGYETDITYVIFDQLSTPLPSDIDWNEQWTTGITTVYSGTNWPQNPVSPATALYNGTDGGPRLLDVVQGPGVNNQPPNVPQPTCAANPSVEVVKWGQAFSVGSQTTGAGVQVQQDTLHKWIDHGAHTIP